MGVTSILESQVKIVVKLLVVLIIAALPLLIFAMPVLAIDPPDSDPEVTSFYANVNLVEEGDVLIYGTYDIPYATTPNETADYTHVFLLLDSDAETQLGAVLPFVRYDNGYNEGAFGFYFSAADNLTTDNYYTIRIRQNPDYFESPESYDYLMPMTAWTSHDDRETNQTEVAINIINIAKDLENAHDETLLESCAGTTVLSDPEGETYFRGVIYGIQVMAPKLFLVQVYNFETGDRAWTTEQFDEYMDRFTGTWIGTATANTSSEFGMTTPTLMAVLYGVPIMLGSVIISAIKFRRIEPAYLIAALVLILLSIMGWISKALFATIYQLLAIYISYLLFYARSST